MKIGITLDQVISSSAFSRNHIDDDLFCLNQIATEQGWYASSRWFAGGHDVFFITSRTNSESTERWLEEWAIMYNKVVYGIPFRYHYNTAVALDCDIFVTSSVDELPKHDNQEVKTFFIPQDSINTKVHKEIDKINGLNDLDM